ncbi:MAG TPA: AbrB/MazE/SpoVT family DNA-binding domain-containing protein [Nitrospiria bacterium]|nr:AbrB/MazE/SpoVT family DNA-binding domain-containing protein [Nitrospiria bacterium]
MPTQIKHVLLGKRNQITLPKEFVPENISMFECEQREDGSIVLIPHITIPASQAFFWTSRWQKGEKAASKDIEEGRITHFRSGEAMLSEMAKRRKKK